jgi:hypothetical protein
LPWRCSCRRGAGGNPCRVAVCHCRCRGLVVGVRLSWWGSCRSLRCSSRVVKYRKQGPQEPTQAHTTRHSIHPTRLCISRSQFVILTSATCRFAMMGQLRSSVREGCHHRAAPAMSPCALAFWSGPGCLWDRAWVCACHTRWRFGQGWAASGLGLWPCLGQRRVLVPHDKLPATSDNVAVCAMSRPWRMGQSPGACIVAHVESRWGDPSIFSTTSTPLRCAEEDPPRRRSWASPS